MGRGAESLTDARASRVLGRTVLRQVDPVRNRRVPRFLLVALALVLGGISFLGSATPSDVDPMNPDPPYLTRTVPSDAAADIRLDELIEVWFSKPMDETNTFVFSVPSIPLTRVWIDNQHLWVMHDDFEPCTTYRVHADGYDVYGESIQIGNPVPGAPNPWAFTTECSAFTIARTDPEDNQTSVILAGKVMGKDAQNIIVWFTRSVDTSTFRLTLTPSIPLTPSWSKGNTSVTMRHDETLFYDCAVHTVTVTANDVNGNPLTNITGSKPNPWTFTTVCVAPVIMATDPANGTTGVSWGAPIVVRFSKTMDIDSVNWSLSPDPMIPFEENWTARDAVLTLSHTLPFPAALAITVTIEGRDRNGNSLAPGPVPTPWSFTRGAPPPAPRGLRLSRTPPDMSLDWETVPGATSYLVHESPDRFAPWPWPVLAEVPTPSYVHRGGEADLSTHYYIVRAKQASATTDLVSANSTMAVKADLRFEYDNQRTNVYWMSLPYRTIYRKASDLTNELTSSRIDVVGKWDPVRESSVVWFFLRGAWRGTDFALSAGDGFFLGILTSFDWVVNGTDGAVEHSFPANPPPNANLHWTSLPYTGAYARAIDIVLGIEGNIGNPPTRIVEIARWDPILQRYEIFSWSPSGWAGTNFVLTAGEGIRVHVVSAFEWTPLLLTPEKP